MTAAQLAAINLSRTAHGTPLPPVIADVIFFGTHIYKSRVVRDGYNIEEVIEMIIGAMHESAVFLENLAMTAIENPTHQPLPPL